MSLLQSVMVDTKRAWVSFPGISGFEVELATISRPALMKLRKSCMHSKFDKKLRAPIEQLDEDKFISEFARATIKDWKGLTLGKLEDLLPIDLKGQSPDTDVPFSLADAELMLKHSPDFETWVNDSVFDLDNFRTRDDGENLGTTREVAE